MVIQALENNFEATVILRNPDSFSMKHNNLRIVKGDVLKPASFEKEFFGKDAVISCLGTGISLKPTNIYSQGIENILAAMKNTNAQHIICISAGAVEANKEIGFFIRLLITQVLQRILKNVYADMQTMEKILAASNANYTVMRPASI